jgi:predicted MPP superfamily phosphohydrolase
MPPERLARIVGQVNALEPDIVLIAGDLVSEKRTANRTYTAEEVVAPLGKLDAPLGVFAVPGNHDHWFDMPALADALRRHGVRLLVNQAAQAGPLVLGGLDDAYTGRADVPRTIAAMDRLEGGRLIFGHSPDSFPQVPASVPLMLAGHTHCGQIAYPWGGAPAHLSDYGDRYGCGRIDEDGKTLVVGAGLGTSLIPVRLFTQPEIWLIELRAK